MRSSLIASVLVLAQLLNASPVAKDPLRFNSNGKFKIMNFADLHYGEFAGNDEDSKSTSVMRSLLNMETPDFVVFTGDLLTADGILINPGQYIDQCFEAVSQGGYKWASTYGNHDNGVTISREHIFGIESRYANTYTQHGDPNLPGLTNYYLPVYPQEGDVPAVILWFFDTRGGFYSTTTYPSYVDEAVVQWFMDERDKINAKWGKIPALAFFHIPTIDYEFVQDNIEIFECVGLVDDAVVPQDLDTGFMFQLLNSTVLTTFVGHDHGNSWCCKYETLEICYNRRTGYGGYGDWDRGARVVELDLSRDIWTERANYVRLENGTMVDIWSL